MQTKSLHWGIELAIFIKLRSVRPFLKTALAVGLSNFFCCFPVIKKQGYLGGTNLGNQRISCAWNIKVQVGVIRKTSFGESVDKFIAINSRMSFNPGRMGFDKGGKGMKFLVEETSCIVTVAFWKFG